MNDTQPDFYVSDHGSVVLLTPNTLAAGQWIEDHLPADVTRWGGAVVLEPRYVDDIVDGIALGGLRLTLSGSPARPPSGSVALKIHHTGVVAP